MATRPSTAWRENLDQEERDLAAGKIQPHEDYCHQLFPESLLVRTDEVLAAFEAELTPTRALSDEQVFAIVERVVRALNAVNEEHGGAGYETGEREVLCAYIDASLEEAGISVAALADRRGIGRYEITDEWRYW